MNENRLDGLVDCIGQLMEMQNEDNERKAAALYRAMFVNDKDINKLDFNYSYHILGYIEFGCQNAIIDYKNYLQYLKILAPEEYPSHLRMYEESMKRKSGEE